MPIKTTDGRLKRNRAKKAMKAAGRRRFQGSFGEEVLVIKVTYTCELCGMRDREVDVPARQDEGVVEWMQQVAIPAIGADHASVSPDCRPNTLTNIKIPVSGAEKIGGVVRH